MLRSVVGALATNMMLVLRNPDVPISLVCSTGSALVLTTASPKPRPWWSSMACNQADDSLELRGPGYIRRLNVGSEVGIIAHIRCRTTAMRLARAIVANLAP